MLVHFFRDHEHTSSIQKLRSSCRTSIQDTLPVPTKERLLFTVDNFQNCKEIIIIQAVVFCLVEYHNKERQEEGSHFVNEVTGSLIVTLFLRYRQI